MRTTFHLSSPIKVLTGVNRFFADDEKYYDIFSYPCLNCVVTVYLLITHL